MTASQIWKKILVSHRFLWFSFHISRHSVLVWMAILDRLPTKDRLLARGMNIDDTCVIDALTWELDLEWTVKYYNGKSLIALILRLV
ncbi:hypothetical protein GQ457_12G022400 [Hibiscus cannabinus]